MREEVFVLCTGSSLNNLTEEEKDYVRSKKHICVNRYPVFWEMIGIEPEIYIMVDNWLSEKLLTEVCRKTKGLKIITTEKNNQILQKLPKTWDSILVTGETRNRRKFIDKISPETSLFWSSVLGSAVNASTILFPGHDIKILGLDGGMTNHYWTGKISKNKLDHSNPNQKHNSHAMLKHGMKYITSECSRLGVNVSCCNIKSQWVREKKINYSPVIPDSA